MRALLKDGTIDVGHAHTASRERIMLQGVEAAFAATPSGEPNWEWAEALARKPKREQLVSATQEGHLIVLHLTENKICLRRKREQKLLRSWEKEDVGEIFSRAVIDHNSPATITTREFIDCGQPRYDPYCSVVPWEKNSCSLSLTSHLGEVWQFNGRDITPTIAMLTKDSLRPQPADRKVVGDIVCTLPDRSHIGISANDEAKKGNIVCLSTDLQATNWSRSISADPITAVHYIPPVLSETMDYYLEVFSPYFPREICRLIVDYLLV